MKYYNLSDIEARYFAGNPDTATLVVGLEQPVYPDCGGFVHEWKQRMLAKYPIGTIIGLKHKRKVVGAYEVTGARVCRVQEVTPTEWYDYGMPCLFDCGNGVYDIDMLSTIGRFNAKHAHRVHPLTWADNSWVLVAQTRRA